MKLTVFGVTGEAGRQLVEQALVDGHEVTAFVRHPSKLTVENERLSVLQGELHEVSNIERAVNGADAIISLLGPRPGDDLKSKMLTHGTQNIVIAMKKSGVRRIIVTATPSASAPNDLPDFKFKVLVTIIKTAMRPAYEEIVGVARIVQNSGLDWTVVRVSMLNDYPKSGKVRVGYLGRGEVGVKLSRADMAGFILDELKNKNYIGQMPAISN